MTFNYISSTVEDLQHVAAQILKDAGSRRLFALHGEMGAGKTTLIKAMCKCLGVVDAISSPTFAIMNEYRKSDGQPVYHFDFYRIKNITEAFDLGYENFFFSGHYCFIEWPEKVESLLNTSKAAIFITFENNQRSIQLSTQ